jgi:hypothetical protein
MTGTIVLKFRSYLGAPDGLISLRKELIQGVVVDVWREIPHPDGCVCFSSLKASAVVIELESHRWVAIWNNLATEAMHGQNRPLISA